MGARVWPLCAAAVIGVVAVGVASAAHTPRSPVVVHTLYRHARAPFRPATDPDLEPGFPVQTYEGAGTYHGGPAIHALVGNIDSDPQLEILATALASGPLYAWN